MKRLVVRIHHSTHPPFKIKILPNTKVSDVLAYLNLEGDYVLCRASEPNTHFHNEEALYDPLSNDETLIAKFSTEKADAFMEHIAFGEGEI
jgi:hypothetical protein